ncbi:hypothetical protein ATER59S_01807 [Aquamicrobium terrae]|uniref:hypothetical protein n=1 Tax=Mesorhizobium sp. PUT5 TaxID=3454629 RepID=UPI003FA47405
MIKTVLIAGSLTAIAAFPAFAATDYWVAQDAGTKKCQVVSSKPDGKKMMDVGSKMYTAKANAEKAMKMLSACK